MSGVAHGCFCFFCTPRHGFEIFLKPFENQNTSYVLWQESAPNHLWVQMCCILCKFIWCGNVTAFITIQKSEKYQTIQYYIANVHDMFFFRRMYVGVCRMFIFNIEINSWKLVFSIRKRSWLLSSASRATCLLHLRPCRHHLQRGLDRGHEASSKLIILRFCCHGEFWNCW